MRIKAIYNEHDSRQFEYIRFIKQNFPQLINEENPELYYVVGGDGSMMFAHKNVDNKNIPFFGKGLGTANFIMNNFEYDDIVISGLLNNEINLNIIESIKISVQATLKTRSYEDSIKEFFYEGINDIVIGSDIMDYNKFIITSEDRSFNNLEVHGSGLCISTPLGSTAFNLNNKGIVLPIESNMWSFTSIACNKNINEIIYPQNITIKNISERSCPIVYIDGKANSFCLNKDDVFTIKPSRDKFKIAYIDVNEFHNKRIRLVQEKR